MNGIHMRAEGGKASRCSHRVALLVGERRTEEVASAIPARGLLAGALKQAMVKPMGIEPSVAHKAVCLEAFTAIMLVQS